ncbi:hypothetical protein JCM3765_006090 [Sporobolomyces pararoseus]
MTTNNHNNNNNTRLVITCLHPSVTPQDLRSHLSQCPQLSSPSSSSITDVKLVTRKDGTSRCLAFIGFKTNKDASKILEWSQNSWLNGGNGGGGSRIKVDWARDTRDSDDRASKRQKLDITTNNNSSTNSSDSRFKDFLAVMQPPKPSTLHDTTTTTTTTPSTLPSTLPSTSTTTTSETSSSSSAAATSKKKSKITPTPITTTIEPETQNNDDDDGVAGDEGLTDAEYLAKRMKRTIDQVETTEEEEERGDLEEDGGGGGGGGFEQEEEEEEEKPEEVEEESESDLTIQSILETGRLFLRNLAFSVSEQDLKDLFQKFGQIDQVHLPVDSTTKLSKGLGYITFSKPQQAVDAYKSLDGTTFQGRLLHILPAIGREAKPERPGTSSGGGNVLKKERMEMRKQVGGKSFSWASLYLNQNAALSAVADKLGVSKQDLLDPSSSSDPAIKVALAEAHTIGEIKQYFENQGVNVDAFSTTTSGSRPIGRSSTCILIKNLPYSTSLNSLTNLLQPFGQTSKILLPPSGTIAIVDFLEKDKAQDCWRSLLYKNFGGNVLYLEKAPLGIWDNSSSSNNSTATATGSIIKPVQSTTTATTTTKSNNNEEAINPDPVVGVGATLFIKNLNFITTSQRLTSHFSNLPGFTFARVQTKKQPDPKNISGKTLSMGYGFLGFKTLKDAQNGLEFIEKSGNSLKILDGHQLEFKFAQRGTTTTSSSNSNSNSNKASGSETTTKMLVKNVPFEATRKELRQLFSAYGQLKSVRLPKKMDNTTRGFAFLDFATRRDAESAFSALEHAHLLGRHLVLQWAGEGEGEEGEGESGGRGGKGKLASFESGRKNLTHKKSKFSMDTE